MNKRAWAIKLGSGGKCIPFCEKHGIIGVGWGELDRSVLDRGTPEELWAHVRKVFGYDTVRRTSSATGQISRFWRECAIGDLVVYYDPPKKQVRICRVASAPDFRTFEMKDPADIWLYRRVEYPCDPISILDFYAGLKGSLLGPRMSFWQLKYDLVEQVALGNDPSQSGASDPEIKESYGRLQSLIKKRCEVLDSADWEHLVADYFIYQGATVSKVGGSQTLIDLEATFSLGEFSEEVWRVQVKRYQDRPVGWQEVEHYYRLVNTENFCFVSAFGFTPEAIEKADRDEFQIRLLQPEDFSAFLLSGRYRPQIKRKLKLAV